MSAHTSRANGRVSALADRGGAGLPITLTGVTVRRGDVALLRGIDLVIERGERIIVLGANGAGKSTLLRLLHGLVPPTAGSVSWDHCAAPPPGQAMVFQRPILLRRSAAANIDYALRLAGVPDDDRPARVFNALQSSGLGPLASRPARRLSGGEQHRLALARAAALAPEVLFLDEPTASLDPAAGRAIEERVQAIHAAGTTIVMATHNLAQARRLAERVVFLQAGRVTEATPAAEFFRAPRSAEAADFLNGERS